MKRLVQSLSHVRLFATPWTTACQASLSFTLSQSLVRLMSIDQWCHPPISCFVVPFSSCPQFPASGSFSVSWLFTSYGQKFGASASASALPVNIWAWFPFGVTGLISLLSKGLSRDFFSIKVQKPQFLSAHPFLWLNSHTHTWLLKKPWL